MKKIILINILLIVTLSMYLTYTRLGSAEFGELSSIVVILFTIVSLFYTEIKSSSTDDTY